MITLPVLIFFMFMAHIGQEYRLEGQSISDMGKVLARWYVFVVRFCVKVNAYDELSDCIALGIIDS